MLRADFTCALKQPPSSKLLRLPPKTPFLAPYKLRSRFSSPSAPSARLTTRFYGKPFFTSFPGAKRSIRASSSSSLFSASPKTTKYDVFISFRGEDTRDSFTSHLFGALRREKIEAFMDNEKLRKGEEIAPSLVEAIEGSRIAVVVFSRDYASSRWCLDELLKILECKKKNGQIVLPVFYDVDPSHIRRQRGSYAAAFAAHQDYYRRKSAAAAAKVKRWRAALSEASNLSGFDSRVIRPESKLVEEVITCILRHLDDLGTSGLDDLVGVESHVEAAEELLGNGKDDVRCVGIWGMAGIGKTTVAGAIYSRICSRFEGCCFLANVREESERSGLFGLRNELLRQILDRNDINVSTPDIRQRFLRDQLRRTRVLIVLDDVSSLRQLEFLVEDISYFCPGSRIVITTRDKNVLKHGVDAIYELKGLADNDALVLFFRCALKQDLPSKDHLRMSKWVLRYANRNPLALKVLGSFLYKKSINEWESAFDRLQKFPDMEIQHILQLSYEELNEEEKEIFLDIACFFKGEDRSFVTSMLDGCGFSADIGIRTLIDKSLVTISKNRLQMHDLIQDMGKEIVRQEAPREPGKRSRLWNHEEIYDILTKDKGTEAVECIFLNLSQVKKMQLSPQAFAKMYNLRFLKFYNTESCEGNCKLHFPEGLNLLPEKLRYLHWHSFPLKSLPLGFCPENLVEFSMNYSFLEQLWRGMKALGNLRRIDLCHSMNLKDIPDLSGATNLERISLRGCRKIVGLSSDGCNLKHLEFLDLSGCSSLREFPEISWNIKELLLEDTAIEELPPTIENFNQLVRLDMRNCKMLKNVSNIGYKLASLEYLNLSGCTKITSFPEISSNLKRLLLEETAIDEIPSSVIFLEKLVLLHLQNCKRLKSLPSNICNLKSLQELNLSGCSNFDTFPEILETMEALNRLHLGGTAIKELPSSIEQLVGLTSLDLRNCESLVSLPDGICSLKSLEDLNLSDCSKLENLPKCSSKLKSLRKLRANRCSSQIIDLLAESLCSLRVLHLSDCGLSEFPSVLSRLSSLTELDVSRNDFERIPPSIKQLYELQSLDVSYSKKLQSLPELPGRVTKLVARDCTSLKTISSNKSPEVQLYPLDNVETYVFTNCDKLGQDARNTIMRYAELRICVLMMHLRIILNFMSSPSHYTRLFSKQIRYLLYRMYDYKDFDEALQGLYRALFDEEPALEESTFTLLIHVLDAIRSRSRLDAQGHMAFVYLMANLYLFYEGKPSINFCFPGTDIPDWFWLQSVGSSISTTLQHDKVSNGHGILVGFAMCAIVEFENYNGKNGLSVKCQCHFHTDNFGSYKGACCLRGWDSRTGSESMVLETDHLFLGYDSSLLFGAAKGSRWLVRYCQHLIEVSFEFSVVDEDGNPLNCCKVVKCGILPLFINDTIQTQTESSDREGKDRGWIQKSSRFLAAVFNDFDLLGFLIDGILNSFCEFSIDIAHQDGKIHLVLAYSFAGRLTFSVSLPPPSISATGILLSKNSEDHKAIESSASGGDNDHLRKCEKTLAHGNAVNVSLNRSGATDRNDRAISWLLFLASVRFAFPRFSAFPLSSALLDFLGVSWSDPVTKLSCFFHLPQLEIFWVPGQLFCEIYQDKNTRKLYSLN